MRLKVKVSAFSFGGMTSFSPQLPSRRGAGGPWRRRGAMAASGQEKRKNKTHRASQRPQTGMASLGLLLSIIIRTILATHIVTDT